LNLLVDRGSVQEEIYGRTGIATANFVNAPSRFVSKSMKFEFNVDKANQILESAGWKRGGDGVRAKDGKKLKFVYQTSINNPRQKTQQIVKQACAKTGIELELKAVTANVFFSSDPANPDTYSHFYTDLQMYTTTMTQPDPQRFMDQFTSWEVSAKDNKFALTNKTRWRNEEYDKMWKAAEHEMDPVKRAALFVKMNDLVIQNVVVIPVVFRPRVAAISNRLRDAVQSGWTATSGARVLVEGGAAGPGGASAWPRQRRYQCPSTCCDGSDPPPVLADVSSCSRCSLWRPAIPSRSWRPTPVPPEVR
jgi:peptide/nickel transport system substrate-binding protein